MSVLTPIVNGDSVVLDRDECQRAGRKYRRSYVNATPYPHIVLEDFLPESVLQRVDSEFPARQRGKFNHEQSRLKTAYQTEMIQSSFITNLLSALNSSQFLGFLENLTGIKQLISDPHYAGAGLHESARGGHLSIHADFNVHPTLPLRRRLNLILFLNRDWKEEFGGHLELWHRDMSECAKRVLPTVGVAAVFNTNEDSYHGHPKPLTCPEDRYRRSLATYYFTAFDDPSLERKTTQFKPRSGTADGNWKRKYSLRDLIHDVCPPIALRTLKGFTRR